MLLNLATQEDKKAAAPTLKARSRSVHDKIQSAKKPINSLDPTYILLTVTLVKQLCVPQILQESAALKDY